jgi:hypothetical protein
MELRRKLVKKSRCDGNSCCSWRHAIADVGLIAIDEYLASSRRRADGKKTFASARSTQSDLERYYRIAIMPLSQNSSVRRTTLTGPIPLIVSRGEVAEFATSDPRYDPRAVGL